jgi:hypothetical protein
MLALLDILTVSWTPWWQSVEPNRLEHAGWLGEQSYSESREGGCGRGFSMSRHRTRCTSSSQGKIWHRRYSVSQSREGLEWANSDSQSGRHRC